jgi:hypothetical protein
MFKENSCWEFSTVDSRHTVVIGVSFNTRDISYPRYKCKHVSNITILRDMITRAVSYPIPGYNEGLL